MSERVAVTLMDHPRVVCRPLGSRGQLNLSPAEFAAYHPCELAPLRRLPARRGSFAFVGRWWFASTGEHVGFGSLVERDVLMSLDFAGGIVEIVDGPLVVAPTRSAPGSMPSPYLFVSYGDQSRALLVHGDDSDAASLAAVFAATPITVATVTAAATATAMQSARAWCGYRFSRCRLPASVENDVLAERSHARSIGDLVAKLADRLDDSSVARAGVYSMLWRRTLLLADSTTPPSDRSLVVVPWTT